MDEAIPSTLNLRRIVATGKLFGGRTPSLWIGAGVLVGMLLLGIVVPMVSPYAPDALVADPFAPPSWSHPFGTDSLGRDVFTRTFAAARVDFIIAAVGVSVPFLVGTALGVACAASRRRGPDVILMRLTDALIAFPFLILVLLLVVIVGQSRSFWIVPAGLPALFFAIFAVGWAVYARLARSQTLALRDREFVVAAELMGYSRTRIVLRHLLPSVIATTATYAVADAILIVVAAASLAFLGAGVPPPTPEWGAMMYEGRATLATSWWITVFPGLALAASGLALSLVADGLFAHLRGDS